MPFDAPATLAPAELPAGLIAASTTAGRPMLVAGPQPGAAAVLLDITAAGVTATTPSLIPEAQAVIAAMAPQPSMARQATINTLVSTLVSAGVWTKLGVLYVFAAADSQAACLNWKAPSGIAALPTSSPAFVADRGFNGDNLAAHIDTRIAWNAIPGLAQDNAHLGAYVSFGGTSQLAMAGTNGSNNVILGRSAGNLATRLNNGTIVTADPVPGVGAVHICASRALAAQFDRYVNGAAVTVGVQASSAIPTGNLTGLRANTSFAAAAASLRALHAGPALTATEVAAVRDAIQAYMAAIGAS